MNKYLLIILFIATTACGGSGTTIANNPTGENVKITIGQLTSDGKSTIIIPQAVFGDSQADVDSSTIDISVNDTAVITDLVPTAYYHDSDDTVQFILSNLENDDELTFTITKSDATEDVYNGIVSNTADSEAGIVEENDTPVDTDVGETLSRITTTICDKLTTCFSELAVSDCETGVLADDQILNQLGGPETDGSDISFLDFQNQLDAGDYTVDESALDTCLSQISALACTDAESAWSSSEPTNFGNIENIVETPCDSVFVIAN